MPAPPRYGTEGCRSLSSFRFALFLKDKTPSSAGLTSASIFGCIQRLSYARKPSLLTRGTPPSLRSNGTSSIRLHSVLVLIEGLERKSTKNRKAELPQFDKKLKKANPRILVVRRCKQAGMHGRHHNAAYICARITKIRSAA